jgi:DNA replication initiation complex subunit (GINS family)
MRQLTEKEFEKIKRLEKEFYEGAEEYILTLQDSDTFYGPFFEIMKIIDNAKRKEK